MERSAVRSSVGVLDARADAELSTVVVVVVASVLTAAACVVHQALGRVVLHALGRIYGRIDRFFACISFLPRFFGRCDHTKSLTQSLDWVEGRCVLVAA